MRLTILACLGCAIAFSIPASSLAQPNKNAATTDAATAGPDFELQGEYLGWLNVSGRGGEPAGLQIVALGDGKFDAVQYRGGLPGNGWDRTSKSHFSGMSENGSLVLTGESGSFVVADRFATAYGLDGREQGRLRRVARRSPTIGLLPPESATVLFGGGSTDQLQGAKVSPDGLLMAGVLTKMPVQAFRMHLEFRTPYMPNARGQARGNSGVYIQQRYEVQILDSFGLEGIENECGGLYRQQRPELNMCLPPLAWQTYDIWFTPPLFDDEGKKTYNARLTVLHNGIPIHLHREVIAKTGGGKQESPEAFPINLQDHGNPVAFRNIWLIPGMGDDYFEASQGIAFDGSAAGGCGCGSSRRCLFSRRCR
jgi:hypothetical protein